MNRNRRIKMSVCALALLRLGGPALAEFDDVYFVQVPPNEVGTPIGYQTWRAVARFTDPTDQLLSVHAESGGTALEFHTNDPAGLKNLDAGPCMGLHAEDFASSPLCDAWDSYVTIGHTQMAGNDTDTSPGFLGGGLNNVIQGSDWIESDDDGWYDADPGQPALAGDGLEIVMAQFTVGVGFTVELGGRINGMHTFGASPVQGPFDEAFYAVGAPGGNPGWNRRIRAITAKPSSGGLHTITVHFEVEAQDISAPVDLSTSALISVNGAGIDLVTVDVTASPNDGGNGPCGLECLLGEVCYCHGVPQECECGHWIGTAETETNLQPEDYIEVLLRPAPGAAEENDPSGDLSAITFLGDDLYWNRRIESIELVPGGPMPDSFFDVWIDLSVDANYDGALGLAAELELLVNGASQGAFPANIDDILNWNQCANVACDDTIACVMDVAGNTFGSCQEDDDGPLTCSCQYHPVPNVIPGVLLAPGDEIVVILRPVPGALPELPGFEDDDFGLVALPPSCTGDIDGNGIVDFQDLLAVLAAWGPCAGCPADTDGNDTVDFVDLLAVLAAWGPCP